MRAVIGLLICLVLAYLAGHPRVQQLEDLIGLSQVVAAGFPFFVLGAIAHAPGIELLPDHMLDQLTPLLELGLGWLGLVAGFQFDVGAIGSWPRHTARLSALLTFVPFFTIAASVGLVLWALEIPTSTSRLLRDAAMIGAAGCMAAPTAIRLLASKGLSERASHVVRTVAVVDDIAGIALLGLLSAFYRPTETTVAWELPGIGWVFVTLGMGLSLAVLIYVVLRSTTSPSELTSLLLASVALAAGGATFFSVSPIVICFIVGVVLTNLPGEHKDAMRVPLARLERPIYLLFLVVAGALWRFDAWQGWLLLPLVVASRVLGRTLAAHVARRGGLLHVTPEEEATVVRAFAVAPIGALSIAIVVNVQTLYPGRAVPLMITAVVGGALLSEMIVQLAWRRSKREDT